MNDELTAKALDELERLNRRVDELKRQHALERKAADALAKTVADVVEALGIRPLHRGGIQYDPDGIRNAPIGRLLDTMATYEVVSRG